MNYKLFIFNLLLLFFSEKIEAQIDSTKIPKPQILGINHIGVTVKNLPKSVDFYEKVFGLKKVDSIRFLKPLRKTAHLNRKTTIISGPNANIHLTEYDKKGNENIEPIADPGITHICYQVPSTRPVHQKFTEFGGSWISRGNKPVDLGGYGIQYSYVRDPNQILFENEQMDTPHFQEDTWIGHVAIACTDIDKMVDFYTIFLGKKPHRRSEVNKDNPKLDAIGDIDHIRLKGAWFRTENMVFEFWQYLNPKPDLKLENKAQNSIGYTYISFETENVKQEYKRLKALGIKVLHKPTKAKNSLFQLRDPEGNLLEIQEIHDSNSLKFKKKLTEK
jgi:catechol 2,3-dioxygenase-like lactoylglutathione lyase family enzyme